MIRISILIFIYTIQFPYLKVHTKFENTGSNRTPYTWDATFFLHRRSKEARTSRAGMARGKLTLFLLLQTLKRRVASQDFAEKQSVPAFMFRHK